MMKRRIFVRKALQSLPAFALLPSLLQSCKKELTNLDVNFQGRVVIVGAGIAGLHAAWFLTKHGCEVIHLEASNRIGGRIRTLENFTDVPIELGADHLIGKRSLMFDHITAKGFDLMESELIEYYRLYGLLRTATEVSISPEFSFLDQVTQSFGAFVGNEDSVSDYLSRIEIDENLENLSEAMIGQFYGTSNERLSVKGLATDQAKWTSGTNKQFFKTGSFIEYLERAYMTEISKVMLNKVVSDIYYEAGTNRLEVQTNDESSYICDRLVITVPLKILKSGSITFHPPLPAKTLAAFESMDMDSGLKIILKFNERFWPENMGSITGGSLIPHYNVSKGVKESNENVLTALVSGAKAEELIALGSAALGAILNELDQIFSSNLATSSFIDHVMMNWGDEEFIGGMNSYVKAGELNKRNDLAEPIGYQIYFAGEACNNTGHAGTVHGAMESAYNQCKLILTSAEA